MKLNVQREGRGHDLVLLHGWGLHSGIWKSIYPELVTRYRLHLVDLPGHGYNHSRRMPDTMQALATKLLDVAPPRAHWLGWSLGGMAAMAVAMQAAHRVASLVLVACTPKFVQATDWPHAVRPGALDDFLKSLQDDYRSTVRQFMALQVHGDETARQVLRDLRKHLFDHGQPSQHGLSQGLKLLRDTDLRAGVTKLAMPALVITGNRDRLSPPASGRWLSEQLQQGRHVDIARAAHAAFLSHPLEFNRALDAFLATIRADRQAS